MTDGTGDTPQPIDAGKADAALRFSLVQQGVAAGGQKPPVPLNVDDAGGENPSRTYHFTVGSDRKIYGRDDALPAGPSFPMTMTLRTMQGVMVVHSRIFRPDELDPDALRWDGGSSMVHADLPSDQGKGFQTELRNEHRMLQFVPQDGDYLGAIRANIVALQDKGFLFRFTVADDAMAAPSNTGLNVGAGVGPAPAAAHELGGPLPSAPFDPAGPAPEANYGRSVGRFPLRPRIAAGAIAATAVIGIGGYLLFGVGDSGKANNQPAPAQVAMVPTAGPPVLRSEGLRELLSGIMEPEEIDAALSHAAKQEPAYALIYSIPGTTPGVDAPYLHIDGFTVFSGTITTTMSGAPLRPLFGACASQPVEALLICDEPTANAAAPGAYLFGGVQVGAPIPLNDTQHAYTYSLVLDADGSPANNFQAAPDFKWDYFQNTDLWVQLTWGGPNNPNWSLGATRLNGQQREPVNADVRAMISKDSILFMLPRSLVPDADPGVRFTTFQFNGTSPDPATAGGAVTGGDPTKPLAHIGANLPEFALSASASAGSTPSSGDTSDPKAQWQARLQEFVSRLRVRDNDWLFAHLNPAVLQVYGADQCKSSLAGRAPDPTINIDIVNVTGPASWPYTAEGKSVAVDGVFTVESNGTAHGETAPQTYHFTYENGGVGWFTQCMQTQGGQ
jgi:hypothetical protein